MKWRRSPKPVCRVKQHECSSELTAWHEHSAPDLGRQVLIITHGGVIRAIVGHMQGSECLRITVPHAKHERDATCKLPVKRIFTPLLIFEEGWTRSGRGGRSCSFIPNPPTTPATAPALLYLPPSMAVAFGAPSAVHGCTSAAKRMDARERP